MSYWGLNSQPTPPEIPPPFIVMGFYVCLFVEIGSGELFSQAGFEL
jgi:hypothetical protein